MQEKYIKQLSKEFHNVNEVKSEILNLKTILTLPKGTEFFFSDLHGEYDLFNHLLRSASGIIKKKIDLLFSDNLNDNERLYLAHLIYYPHHQLPDSYTKEWYIKKLIELIQLTRFISKKYTRSKVSKKLPDQYRYLITEMMNIQDEQYFLDIVDMLYEIHDQENFLCLLCQTIRSLCIDQIHIIGDIFDRGPRPDYIVDELSHFSQVDIQWGNHDISWMGAACGNLALIANVIRISLKYNNLDVLEDGYGINLRVLSDFAKEIYENDKCINFYPHVYDENRYDRISKELLSKMHKAITIIQLKLENQLIQKHKDYNIEYIDWLNNRDYQPADENMFDSYELTAKEKNLMFTLQSSFLHSIKLQKHIKYIYSKGSMYKISNNNLLFHGCIPMNKDGSMRDVCIDNQYYSGKKLLDKCETIARKAFYFKDEDSIDFMWYLWCGKDSPLFGKNRMLLFENYFIKNHGMIEEYDPYYQNINNEYICHTILQHFDISGHIINGHVPVKEKEGESPIRGNGKALIIDGGLSKAFFDKTGISGYTLIYDSRHLYLAKHKMFDYNAKINLECLTPQIDVIETYKRIKNKDIDIGKQLQERIKDLEKLLRAYQSGLL